MRFYIFAANYQHAVYCARNILGIGIRNFTYVGEERQILGLRKDENIEFFFYETFPDHPNAYEINQRARMILAMDRTPQVQPNDTLWWRLVNLNPALLRGLIMAVVLLLSSVGILISPEVPNSLIGFIATVLAIVQALWTKGSVTPNAKVAVSVPDPINAPGVVEAGDAVTTANGAQIITAARASGKPEVPDGSKI